MSTGPTPRISLPLAEARALYWQAVEARRERRQARDAAHRALLDRATAQLKDRTAPRRGGRQRQEIAVGRNIEDPRDLPSRHWRNGER